MNRVFTGLIEDIGVITGLKSLGNYQVITIQSRLAEDGLTIGDSVACDGACLTVVAVDGKQLVVEASQETTQRTVVNSYSQHSKLNLERALKVGDRLGGHFVTGHIDCTGSIKSIRLIGASKEIEITFDKQYDKLVIEKGSVAINGISLTINTVNSGRLTVNVIPHTLATTTIEKWKKRDLINLEFDMIGKYIIKIHNNIKSNGLTKNMLIESGW